MQLLCSTSLKKFSHVIISVTYFCSYLINTTKFRFLRDSSTELTWRKRSSGFFSGQDLKFLSSNFCKTHAFHIFTHLSHFFHSVSSWFNLIFLSIVQYFCKPYIGNQLFFIFKIFDCHFFVIPFFPLWIFKHWMHLTYFSTLRKVKLCSRCSYLGTHVSSTLLSDETSVWNNRFWRNRPHFWLSCWSKILQTKF